MTNGEKIQTILDIDRDCTDVHGENGTMTFTVTSDFWNAEYKEPNKSEIPTGSDCVSREKVWYMITGGKYSDEDDEQFIDRLVNKLAELPPVTPQEPRKGEWLRMSDLSEQEDDRYKCSRCGNVIHHKNEMNLYTFNSWCGRCGSDNSRHINCEVKE